MLKKTVGRAASRLQIYCKRTPARRRDTLSPTDDPISAIKRSEDGVISGEDTMIQSVMCSSQHAVAISTNFASRMAGINAFDNADYRC